MRSRLSGGFLAALTATVVYLMTVIMLLSSFVVVPVWKKNGIGVGIGVGIMLVKAQTPEKVQKKDEEPREQVKKQKSGDFTSLWKLIAHYSKSYDLEGLHAHLKKLFDNSERHLNPAMRKITLSTEMKLKSGCERTTKHKLMHDLEQFEYIKNYPNIGMMERAKQVLFDDIPRAYKALLNKYERGQVDPSDYYYFDPVARPEDAHILEFYNRAIFLPPYEATVTDTENYNNQVPIPLLNPNLNFYKYERQWFGEDPDHKYAPGVILIDNLLSPKVLDKVQQHADDAAINLNIWITPSQANLDPQSGGLVVFTAKPPVDWTFLQFNSNWQ